MMIKNKLPKLKFAIFGLLILLLALSPVTPVLAQGLGLGHGFYGTVEIGDEGAEIGSVISAQIDGAEYGSCQVSTAGDYALIVQGSIDDGATINFYINDQKGDQTFLFHDGWTTELGLTVPEIAPEVDTSAATSVTPSSATLNGNLGSLGTALSVEVSFDWGRTTAYGNTAIVTASPLGVPGVFSATLSGLVSDTTYHFRARAEGDGTGYGAHRTFTTRAIAVGLGVGGAPPAPAAPPAGTTDVRGDVSTAGVFLESVSATSEDGLCTLTIPEGTVGLTEDLEPLTEITSLIMDEPPPPPEAAHVIGLTYDFGPDGATFEPPIPLTWSYDPADIPEGIAEQDLVLAMWDEELGEWVELEGCVVDPATHTITASVSHFTTFAIIARAPVPPPVAPPPTAAPPPPPPPPVEEVVPPPPPEEEEAVPEVPVKPPVNWTLVGTLIAVVVVVVVLLGSFLVRRRA